MTTMHWRDEQFAAEKVGWLADAIVLRLNLSAPIDPFRIVKGERPLLRVGGRDFGNRFDGKICYVPAKLAFS